MPENPEIAIDTTTDTAEIQAAERKIIDAFQYFDDWMERYQYLIDLGRKLPPFPEAYQREEYRLHGCQSQVWLHCEPVDGRLRFQAISDSTIVSGLIALLLKIYSERSPAAILATEPRFIHAIGLDKHLSPTRNNGLHAMLKAIYGYARQALDSAHSSAGNT